MTDQGKSSHARIPDRVESAAETTETDFGTERTYSPESRRRPYWHSGFAASMAGGAVAACLGFAAGQTGLLTAYINPLLGLADPIAEISAVRSDVAENNRQIGILSNTVTQKALPGLTRLDARLEKLEENTQLTELSDTMTGFETLLTTIQTQMASIESRLTVFAERLTEYSDRLDDFMVRIAELELRNVGSTIPAETVAAYRQEVSRLTETLRELRTEAERLSAKANESQVIESPNNEGNISTEISAYLVELQIAVTGGLPYSDLLERLAVHGLEVPPELDRHARNGVPTLSALIAAYPAAARAALAASDSNSPNGLGNFLANLLVARSVTPRQGNDPDAILSRAEAAATDGHLETALLELSALTAPARAKMSNWMTLASARINTLDALATLSATHAAN